MFMFWVSLALHAVPIIFLSRASLITDSVPTSFKVLDILILDPPPPSPPLPELIRPSTKLVTPSPRSNILDSVRALLPLTPEPVLVDAIQELKPLLPITETRAQTPPLPDSETYLSSADVDQQADLLVPIEPSLFADDFTLSGSLILQIEVNARGGIDRFEVLDSATDGHNLKLAKRLTEWFKDKTFNPARKDGYPVPSTFRFNFNIGRDDDPLKNTPNWPPPGYRPKLDSKGNAIWPAGPNG